MDMEEGKRRRLATALDYNACGLVMVPMHAVVNGVCQGWHEVSPGDFRRGGTCTHKPGKHPAGKWSRYRNVGAPNRPEDLHKWVGRDRNLGVLMDCGTMRIWVADCDTQDAMDYVISILGPTPCVVETGRDGGGWHLYYLLPDGVSMKTDNGSSFKGLDIKTSGYVIAPWGRHQSGRYYTPQDGFDLTQAPIADPRRLQRIQPLTVPGNDTDTAQSQVSTKSPKEKHPNPFEGEFQWYFFGQRNNQMYDLAYRYRLAQDWLRRQPPCIQGEKGRDRLFRITSDLVRWYLLDESQTLGLLIQFNHRHRPPWSIEELVETVDRAFELGTFSGRGRLSYIAAHKRDQVKSMKAAKRRSARRRDIRDCFAADLQDFLSECCVRDTDHKATTPELWAAFCDYAPWVSPHSGLFGNLLWETLQGMHHGVVQRKRGGSGYVFYSLKLLDDYLQYCPVAC